MSNKLTVSHIPGNYQYVALHYGNSMQKQWHKNRHNLLKFLNFFNHKDIVLDLGCGSGNIVLEFTPKVKRFLGVDDNQDCLLFLEEKIRKRGIKNAHVLKMDLTRLNLKREKFSKVIMTEILEHFDQNESKKILHSVREMLTARGKIFITTPNYQSLWPIMELLIDKLNLAPKLWGEQHRTKFNLDKLKRLLKETGFTTETTGTLNIISPLVAFFNPNFADKLSFIEFKSLPLGNLLYCVAIKDK